MIAALTGGQAGDNPMLATLVKALAEGGYDQDFRLLADKAYSHRSTRILRQRRTTKHATPETGGPHPRPTAMASKGGRPPGFDSETYKQRNTIERSFSRVKQWRGLATRYDKYAVTFLGGFTLAMVILTHRANH
mgnify:CR=1 FL=1